MVYVREVRARLFGSKEPPFTSRGDAIAWVEGESCTGLSPEWLERKRRFEEVRLSVRDQIQEAYQGFPIGLRMELTVLQDLVQLHADDKSPRAYIATTERLRALVEAATEIEQHLRCLPGRATLLILVGEHVLAHRQISGRVSRRLGRSADLGGAVVDTSSMSVKAIREAVQREGVRLRPGEIHLLKIIQQLEDAGTRVPQLGIKGKNRGVRAFWSTVMDKWNENLMHNAISDPTALEKRWHRLSRKLGEQRPEIFFGLDFVEPAGDEPASANRAGG
jgi:hypothetical protein